MSDPTYRRGKRRKLRPFVFKGEQTPGTKIACPDRKRSVYVIAEDGSWRRAKP